MPPFSPKMQSSQSTQDPETNTLQGTNISPFLKALLKMIFRFPQVGYVSLLEGTHLKLLGDY